MTSVALLRSIGDLIRARRVSAGMTQRALGYRAGIGAHYVSEIERGTRDIPLSTLHAIVERGLQMQLEIAFGIKGQETTALPVHIAQIARGIADLSGEAGAIAVALARGVVELAMVGRRRETR